MKLRKDKIVSMLESLVSPVAILLTVWYVTSRILRYTLLMQEQKGIFLWTPDYLRQTFSDPWPLTTFISDFLVQFYQNASDGALITAIIVTSIYFCVSQVLRFFKFRNLAGLLASCASWYVIAHSNTPHTGVVILVFSLAACLISTFLPYRRSEKGGSKVWMLQIVATAGLLFGTTFLLAKDKELKDNEKWYAVEYASRSHDWNLVLRIATIGTCRSDVSYVPYALLALNATGQLGEKMMDYPVSGPESLGEDGTESWSKYSLNSLIYEVTGCPNEAIHMTYQYAAAMPHATSFGALRQMIRLQTENEDFTLARKYAEILRQSPRNRQIAENAMKTIARMEAESTGEPMSNVSRVEDSMISNNPVYNMSSIISNCRNSTAAAGDRLLAHLLLSGKHAEFCSTLEHVYDTGNPERLPKYFRLFYLH